jgi:hypothetical protein
MQPHKFAVRGVMSVAALVCCLSAAVTLCPTPGSAQTVPAVVTRKAGKYGVDLRLPEQGLFAQNETDIEFHVADLSQDDPVQGPPPIVKAKVTARITMPTMASMPAQSPKTHAEGVAGDYGVVLYFPHGGDYQIDLTITPPNDKAFTVSYKVSVGDAKAVNGSKKPTPKPYTLEVRSEPVSPEAGKPAELTIVVQSRETRKPVSDFDIVHERQIHFMIVSADMQHFAHEHPVLGSDGKFTLNYTFPTGGEYRLFADVAPKGAGSQILMQPLLVRGPAQKSVGAARFTPSRTDTVDGVQVALATDPATFPVGRSLEVSYTLKNAATGAPITDLEPYLGAMAHLMLIHEDGSTFVHSHPDETNPTNGHDGTITFLARFPKPGFYRGWLQFQRGGTVETATFTWEVRAEKRS